jgi:hypothetical protein
MRSHVRVVISRVLVRLNVHIPLIPYHGELLVGVSG